MASIAASAQSDIRKVDFHKFTYMPSCTGEVPEKVEVTGGEMSREKVVDGYTDRFYFKVLSVAYGDLTGDKQDEAVVLSVCNTGGTGQFTEGFIFSMTGGRPTMIARVPGGDRADGGLRVLTIEDGLLVTEYNDPRGNQGACCPEFVITSKNKLKGNRLVEVGKYVRRELYPKERVAFVKGASEKTFTIKLAPQDRKRYTVGAREGQKLRVSVSTGDATLSLMGDTDVVEGTNEFTAILPRDGDFTFEISNYNEKEIEVTVTVRIN